MQDAWRAYLDLALGLTEASRKKATGVARQLLGRGGATAEQLQALAEDLLKTSRANREAITKLVRYELDRALGALGLATSEEVAELTARVRELEQRLQEAEARAASTTAAQAATLAAPVVPGRKAAVPGATVAKKAVAKKAVAKKAAATKAAKKAVAKKAVAKKAVARRVSPEESAGGAG
jgi:polyhydroxyalkanoate synthesis regulator phasin